MTKKILITDDDTLNISLIRDMLGARNYVFFTALNGMECLELAQQEHPDLIIMDWQMPRMDGMEALRHLKANPATVEIPVLMVTGIMNSPENLVSAMEEGAVDFLRKPFDRLELRARVRNMLLLAESVKELRDKYRMIEERNRMIEALFTGVPHPLVYYSQDGVIIRCNEHFRELVADPKTVCPGTLVYRVFDTEHRNMHMEHDLALISQGEGVLYEGKILDPQKEYLFSKRLISNLPDEEMGIVCMMTEITVIKNAHRDLLDGKKRELVSSALRLIHISELNNNLIADISSLSPYLNKEGKEKIRKMINDYTLHSNESIWQDFESRFEQVYESFYAQLQEQFPDLTPGEKKLCALLRLNVSSKDIAAITFQAPQSVDMARYRLRKKLNLNSQDNLVDFLLKLGL